jgi:hypothetical protein
MEAEDRQHARLALAALFLAAVIVKREVTDEDIQKSVATADGLLRATGQ